MMKWYHDLPFVNSVPCVEVQLQDFRVICTRLRSRRKMNIFIRGKTGLIKACISHAYGTMAHRIHWCRYGTVVQK